MAIIIPISLIHSTLVSSGVLFKSPFSYFGVNVVIKENIAMNSSSYIHVINFTLLEVSCHLIFHSQIYSSSLRLVFEFEIPFHQFIEKLIHLLLGVSPVSPALVQFINDPFHSLSNTLYYVPSGLPSLIIEGIHLDIYHILHCEFLALINTCLKHLSYSKESVLELETMSDREITMA